MDSIFVHFAHQSVALQAQEDQLFLRRLILVEPFRIQLFHQSHRRTTSHLLLPHQGLSRESFALYLGLYLSIRNSFQCHQAFDGTLSSSLQSCTHSLLGVPFPPNLSSHQVLSLRFYTIRELRQRTCFHHFRRTQFHLLFYTCDEHIQLT